MKTKTVLPAVFSLAIALLSAALLLFLNGPASPRTGRFEVAGPLLAFNAVGLGLSVLALARSNPRPVDTSLFIRFTALAAAVGIFLNIVIIEVVFAAWSSGK